MMNVPIMPLPSDDLQKINEEIYKRNAELAVKNRTLSLLYDLYDAATRTIDVNDRAFQIANTVQKSLQLPFFGLLLVPSGQRMCVPLIAIGARLGKVHTFFQSQSEDYDSKDSMYHANTASDTLLAIHRRHLISEHIVEKLFPISLSSWSPWSEQPAEMFYALPLHINNQAIGFIVIGLDKQFDSIDLFERELIENIRNVITISIDNVRNYHDLFAANIRLQELDRQKTEFMSIASHQLRTPLSIIKGYLELIGDGAYGKPSKELKQTLQNMDESNERLVKLVDEFLDVSRIEQGRTKFSFSPTNIEDIITSVIKELEGRAEGKKLSLSWKPTGKIPVPEIDEERIRHVIFNFVDNAIKYSEQGAISVHIKAEDGGIAVRVQDQGLGFEKVDEANFFQKFYRGKNVEGINVTGTGLGIYVCRQFIEAHHGHVWAHSKGFGKGSEFGFWIPIRSEHTAPVTPEPEVSAIASVV